MEIGEPVKKFVVTPQREPIPQKETRPDAVPTEQPVQPAEPVFVEP